VLTRSGDRNLSLGERAELARSSGARVFVSLHADPGRAADVYVHTRAGAESRALAEDVRQSLTGFGAHAGYGAYGGSGAPAVERAELAVLTPERVGHGAAACLVEVDCFRDPPAIDRMGEAIAGGIRRYLGGAGAPAHAPRRYGDAGVQVSNAPPPSYRYRRPGSNVTNTGAFRTTHMFNHNSLTFDFAGLGVDPDDTATRDETLDTTVTVRLWDARDHSVFLAEGSVRVSGTNRGYVQFWNFPVDVNGVYNVLYEVTVYNHVDPQRTVTLRMWLHD